MRNVYTVLSYVTDPPQIGILPLTNPTTAMEEFNTVRVDRKVIGNGLSPSQQAAGNVSPAISTPISPVGDGNGSTKVGLKILGGVLGFLIVAGLLMWASMRVLRRRLSEKPNGGGEEVQEVQENPFMTSGEKPRPKTLAYDDEEAFSMFSAGRYGVPDDGGRKSPELVAASRRSLEREFAALKASNMEPAFPIPRPSQHRPQLSDVDGAGRASSDSLFLPTIQNPRGAFSESRYPSVYSVHSVTSSVKAGALDGEAVPMQTLDYRRQI